MAAIIGTGIQIAGKNSRISADGTILSLAKFNVVDEVDNLDTTNFTSTDEEGNCFEEGISGVERLRWTLGGLWDAGTNPEDDPPGIYPRDDLPNLILYLNVAAAQSYDMPFTRVRSSTVGTDVKGSVTFDAAGLNQGPFTVPTGSVS